MNNLLKLLVLICAVLLAMSANSQQSSQLGTFNFLPQAVYANPAIKPKGKLNIGIPALSSIYVEHNNNWFKPDEFLVTDGKGTATLAPEKILQNIDKYAFLGQATNIELLHIGLKFGKDSKHYVHFSVAERSQFGLKIPEDVFNLAVYGNAGQHAFKNNTANLSNLSVNGIHYREYALGYNIDLTKKLSVGLRAKYLYGMETIKTRESSLQLHTDPDTYVLQSSGNIRMQTSGIYGLADENRTAVQSNIGSYLTGLKNTGIGADIGVVYRPIEKLQLEVSANDLGFINWKSDVATLQSGNAEFLYNGVNLTDFIFDTGSEFDQSLQGELDSIVDQLENTYDFETTHNSFKTHLQGYLRYAASYELFNINKFKGSAWANFIHGLNQNYFSTFSMGYNQVIGHGFQLGVHYTKRKASSGSFGAGMVYNAGPVQFYCLADNFRFARLTRMSLIDDQGNRTQIIYPTNPDDIRVNFGINLTFGMKEKDPGVTML